MRAAVLGAWGGKSHCPDCRLPGREELRKELGCDSENERSLYAITCPACDGHASACETCIGTGVLRMHRCPSSYATPEVNSAFRAYNYSQDGTWPVDGGLYAQSASFLEFCSVVNGERAAVEAAERKQAEWLERKAGR